MYKTHNKPLIPPDYPRTVAHTTTVLIGFTNLIRALHQAALDHRPDLDMHSPVQAPHTVKVDSHQ